MNKRGEFPTQNLIGLIVFAFLAVLVIGVFIYGYNELTTSLFEITVQSGQYNISQAVADTMGQMNQGLLNQANIVSIALLLGMVLAIIILGFVTREKNLAVFWIVDFLLIIFSYIIATYISNAFGTVLNEIPFKDIFIENMSFATTFMLKLPVIVVITGVITSIVSYTGIVKSKEEEVAGF